jgi:hypothetical protein
MSDTKINFYKQVLDLFNNLDEETKKDYELLNNISRLRDDLELTEVQKLFDIKIYSIVHKYFQVQGMSDTYITYFDDSGYRGISWSDDGRQPKDEYLYQISFPTGGYLFVEYLSNDVYPKEKFEEFFNELKAFNPKYSDTRNHSLYFTPETVKQVHDAFPEIFKKYSEIIQKDLANSKIQALEDQIAKLKQLKESN